MIVKAEKKKERVRETTPEWERKAKDWLSSFPKGHELSPIEVDNWVNSNISSLPLHFNSLPKSHLFHFFSTLLPSLPSHSQAIVKHVNRGENPARFQRSDQWLPVYSWLESLDLNDVLSSKEISDWLVAHPEVFDQLSIKHTRHHLLHYVKKCHIKILKRKLGKHFKPSITTQRVGQHPDMPGSFFANPLTNISKDSDLYRVKREEAVRKFEILVELEKKLAVVISERHAAGNSSGS